MSSPNAKASYTLWDRARIALHRRASHQHRVEVLLGTLAPRVPLGGSLLDVGCGDLRLAAGLKRERGLQRCVGADIWPLRQPPPEGLEYRQIASGAALPFGGAEFDAVTLVDTLHHAEEPGHLLREALRVGRRVLVKDHFEHGRVSRALLQLLDYLGNRAYGVPIPGRYFTPGSFATLVEQAGGPDLHCEVAAGLDLYAHIPLASLVLRPNLHFVACLEHGR